jgi:hypothetical protein
MFVKSSFRSHVNNSLPWAPFKILNILYRHTHYQLPTSPIIASTVSKQTLVASCAFDLFREGVCPTSPSSTTKLTHSSLSSPFLHPFLHLRHPFPPTLPAKPPTQQATMHVNYSNIPKFIVPLFVASAIALPLIFVLEVRRTIAVPIALWITVQMQQRKYI